MVLACKEFPDSSLGPRFRNCEVLLSSSYVAVTVVFGAIAYTKLKLYR